MKTIGELKRNKEISSILYNALKREECKRFVNEHGENLHTPWLWTEEFKSEYDKFYHSLDSLTIGDLNKIYSNEDVANMRNIGKKSLAEFMKLKGE